MANISHIIELSPYTLVYHYSTWYYSICRGNKPLETKTNMNSSMYRATGLLAIKNELVLANMWNKQALVSAFIVSFASYVIIRSVFVVIANI